MSTLYVATFKLNRKSREGLKNNLLCSTPTGISFVVISRQLELGKGINDISTGHRIGTILWKDVVSLKVMDDISNLKRKDIVLKVKNPNEYIDREPTVVKNVRWS